MIISLTTIPPRIINLKITLQSILDTDFIINKIIIHIPTKYVRFPNCNINDYKNILNDIKNLSTKIEINYCDKDYGPATKIIPIYEKKYNYINDNEIIIFLDDDRKYTKQIFNKLLNQSQKFPKYCITNAVWDTRVVSNKYDYKHLKYPRAIEYKKDGYGDIILGLGGVLIKKYMLYNHNFNYHINKCGDLFYCDDLFLSAILANNNIFIYSITDKEPKRHISNGIKPLANIDRFTKYDISMSYLIKELNIWNKK